MQITNPYIDIPKIDLHCHLDGSFSPEFVNKALNSSIDKDLLLTKLQAPENCSSLTEYLTCFDLPISILQTKENITDGVLDVLSQAKEENLAYIELRFAPNCSTAQGLSLPEIYESAIQGCKNGLEMYGIHSNIILCAMRHHSLEDNLKILETMSDYIGYGICALDLAGDESVFHNSSFTELFKRAKDMNIPFTIHSGECGSYENVGLAMEFGASRIGHGIALINNYSLMQEIKAKGIGLELCPISNFQTKAWSHKPTYPLRSFLDAGLLATINTDNRTVSNTCLSKELEFSVENLDIKEEDFITMYKNSVEIAFADDNIKDKLLNL